MNHYFPVSLNDKSDNGLGFMQGSTDGVYNQYYTTQCNRTLRPEISRTKRNKFNLVGCNSAYKCHYNPYPLENDNYNELEYNNLDNTDAIQYTSNFFTDIYYMLDKMDMQNKTVFACIVAILILFVLFGRN